MVHFKVDGNRNDLMKTAEEMGLPFKEQHLFAVTRFMQYANRTYDNFDMWPAMVKVLERISASDSSEAIGAQKGFKVFLQDPQFVLRLAFMKEISKELTILSKEFQRDDVFRLKRQEKISWTLRFLSRTINHQKSHQKLATGFHGNASMKLFEKLKRHQPSKVVFSSLKVNRGA